MSDARPSAVIILAAGEGTRMRSALPKVMHPIGGRSLAEYLDWFNHRRLHGEIGLVPPVELEKEHYRHKPVTTTVAASVQSLH